MGMPAAHDGVKKRKFMRLKQAFIIGNTLQQVSYTFLAVGYLFIGIY
jgi:hypothetical protein